MSIYEASITNPKKQLEFYKDLSEQLERENKKIKKQLEEINKMIEKCGFVNIEQLMLSYCGLIAQQKEFINYLEDEIHSCEAVSDLLFNFSKEMKVYKEILQKHREVIGVSDEKK